MANPPKAPPPPDPNELVETTTPLGNVVRVRRGDLPSMQAQGAHVSTEAEIGAARENDKYGGVGGMLETGLAGAASGLTFGGSDALVSALGGGDELAAMRRVNPGVSTIGNVAGMVGGALLSGGTSLGARVLSAPTRAIMALGEGAGSLVARGIGEGMLSAGVRAATEGALMGAGQAVSEMAITPDGFDHAGELLASNVGLGALMGGGMGATFSLLGRGASAVGGAARRRLAGAIGNPSAEALENVATGTFGARAPGVGGALKDALARGADLAGATAPGADRVALRELLEPGTRQIAVHADEILGEQVGKLTDALQEMHASQKAMAAEYIGEAKLSNVSRLIENADQSAGEQLIRDSLADTRSTIEKLKTDPEFSTKGAKLKDLSEQFDNASARVDGYLAEGTKEGLANAYMLVDDIKRSAGKSAYGLGTKWEGLSRGARNTWGELTQLYERSRAALEHDAFGAAGVAQKQINAPWAELISGERAAGSNSFKHQFLETTPGYFGRNVTNVSKSKVGEFLEKMTNPAESERWQGLEKYIRNADEFVKAIGEHASLTPEQAKMLSSFETAAKSARESLSTSGEAALRRNQLRALESKSGGSFGSGLIAGAIGAGSGPLGVLGGAISTLRNPARVVRTLAAIDDIVGRSAVRGARATTAIANRTVALPMRTIRGTGVAVGTSMQLGRARAEFERRREMQSRMAQNPQTLPTVAAEAFRDIAPDAPKTTAAATTALANTMEYLGGIMPRLGFSSIPGAQMQPSDAEIHEVNTKARAAEDPMKLADQLRTGEISPWTLDAVRNTAPGVYAKMQSDVMQLVTEQAQNGRQPSYQDRMRLSMALNLQLDPMADPSMIRDMQGVYSPQPPPQQNPTIAEGSEFKRAAKAAQTPNDRIGA